jgi:uncharacterized protein
MDKFLCDQMCGELGRWLRVAGYDTALITTAMRDEQILEKAIAEERLLLTRDRYFLEMDTQHTAVLFLHGETLDEWAEQLKKEAHIDWLHNPFSRCLRCNTPFISVTSPQDVPPEILKNTQEFWYCPTCHQTFWRGSHTQRMENRLRAWQFI